MNCPNCGEKMKEIVDSTAPSPITKRACQDCGLCVLDGPKGAGEG